MRSVGTTKARNFLTEGKPIRFGQNGQEISPKEAAGLIDELERLSGPENADKRVSAALLRGAPRGRGGRGKRGSSGRSPISGGYYSYDSPRGRGRGR